MLKEDFIGNEEFMVPPTFVQNKYFMSPKDEDLVSGQTLRNGDIVMLEDIYHREDDLIRSRWCVVTDLRQGARADILTFIGLYADGTKHTRTYNVSYNWFVKLPTVEMLETETEFSDATDNMFTDGFANIDLEKE